MADGGRCLTTEELAAAQVCGLGIGWDTDNEREAPVQRCHLVSGGEHEQMHPICGATTLWFYDWDVDAGDEITCADCLARLPALLLRYRRRAHLNEST